MMMSREGAGGFEADYAWDGMGMARMWEYKRGSEGDIGLYLHAWLPINEVPTYGEILRLIYIFICLSGSRIHRYLCIRLFIHRLLLRSMPHSIPLLRVSFYIQKSLAEHGHLS